AVHQIDRQEIGVAPDRLGTGLDARATDPRADHVVVVLDLEGTEAELADVRRGGRVAAATLPALQALQSVQWPLQSVGDLSPGMSCTIRVGRPGSPTQRQRFRLLNTRCRGLSTQCRIIGTRDPRLAASRAARRVRRRIRVARPWRWTARVRRSSG